MPFSRIALVVEDEPGLQRAIETHLRAMQFRVLTSFDYWGAVFHLEAKTPDIVCIDLGLPSESGYELCEYIRSCPMLASVPIVLTSDRSFPEDMMRAEDAGANVFLKKPYSMTQLTKTVEMLLAAAPESRPGVRRLRW